MSPVSNARTWLDVKAWAPGSRAASPSAESAARPPGVSTRTCDDVSAARSAVSIDAICELCSAPMASVDSAAICPGRNALSVSASRPATCAAVNWRIWAVARPWSTPGDRASSCPVVRAVTCAEPRAARKAVPSACRSAASMARTCVDCSAVTCADTAWNSAGTIAAITSGLMARTWREVRTPIASSPRAWNWSAVSVPMPCGVMCGTCAVVSAAICSRLNAAQSVTDSRAMAVLPSSAIWVVLNPGMIEAMRSIRRCAVLPAQGAGPPWARCPWHGLAVADSVSDPPGSKPGTGLLFPPGSAGAARK